jgi:hypothetical protein
MNLLNWMRILCAAVLFIASGIQLAAAQESPPPAANQAQGPAPKPDQPVKKKYSHANDFLIRGTVFDDKALSFSGVELRFRREGEKKYKWETYTNSHGEFAQRVPQGANYEILVHVKGFVDQMRTVDANGGGIQENVVFRMQPIEGDKK